MVSQTLISTMESLHFATIFHIEIQLLSLVTQSIYTQGIPPRNLSEQWQGGNNQLLNYRVSRELKFPRIHSHAKLNYNIYVALCVFVRIAGISSDTVMYTRAAHSNNAQKGDHTEKKIPI